MEPIDEMIARAMKDVRLEGGGFDLYFPSIDEGAFVPDLARAAIEHRRAA